jgi:hypothetical protein
VVVLRCAPRPILETLAGLKYVDVREENDVIRFAQEVLTESASFSMINQPLTLLGASDASVLEAGTNLAKEFAAVAAPDVADAEWAGCPYLNLELPLSVAKQISDNKGDISASLLEQVCVSKSDGLAQVFGKYEAQGPLSKLIADERFEALRGFFATIVASAAMGNIPKSMGPRLSADGKSLIPLHARFWRVASRDLMEFEVLLIPGEAVAA